MPILKLLIMNSIERLRLINVWFTGFAILVGTAVFVLVILAMNQYLGYRENVNRDLKKISKSVEDQFLGELSEIHNQLTLINKKFELPPYIGFVPHVFEKTWKYTKPDIGSLYESPETDPTFLQQGFTYPFFYDLMWSDHKGDQRFAISSHFINPYLDLFNLSKRMYFLNARDRNLWTLPHKLNEPPRQFAMQSIRSWVDGSNAIGFSVPLSPKNDEAEVISMVTKLNSVMDPLLSPGYGFCIMDEMGEAWFHSETNKNTQENFIDEADKDDKIIAAIRGRMAVPFESTYHGEDHQMYVEPINNLPLYIVTFYDLNYYKAPLILTIGFALPVTLLMFFLLGIQLFLQYLCVYKPTKLKIHRFYLHWIRPRLTEPDETEKGVTMKPAEKYIRAIVTLGVLAFLSTGLLFIDQTTTVSFCLLVLPLYIFPFLFLLFERETIQGDDGTWGVKNILFHPFIWISAILILLVNIALYKYIDSTWMTIVLQIVFLAIMYAGFRWEKLKRLINDSAPDETQGKHLYHHRLYKAMIFLWLLVVSVLPVFSFYRTAFQQESLMWIKYLQWEGAGKETARRAELIKRLGTLKPPQQDKLMLWGNYLTESSQFSRMVELDTTKYKRQKSKELYYLEFVSRPHMLGIISGTKAMLEAGADDEKWVWYDHNAEPMLAMKYTDETDKPIHYILPKPSLKLWDSDYFILFLTLTAVLAALVCYVTLYAIRSIFGLGIVMDIKLIGDSSKEINLKEMLHDTSLKKIFLVGLPYAGKGELLNQIKTNIKTKDGESVTENRICELNFITQWSKPVKLYDEVVLILRNFDHGINNHEINQRKLEWIQKAIDENASIIISSNSQPSSIIDFYELALRRLPFNDGSEKKYEYKQAIRLWKNILSGFVTYYQPLRAPKDKLKDVGYFIRTELEHGTYLPKLAFQLKKELTNTYAEQENFVMKVEELADTYYHSLWNTFSHDEKFLLYDLAKDRFVNLRNVKAIRLLLQKGIIVAGDSLQLMNKSFNDFILRVVNEDEEIKMQHELNRKGSWTAVYTVLIILVFGLMVFIMLAQQNLLNDINLMLGVLGSMAAIFAKFGGLLSSSKKEQA